MEKWQDSIEFEDDELRHNPALDRYKTLEAALASVPEAQAYRGSSVRIPPQDATAEVLQKWDADMMEKVPGLVRMPAADDAEDTKRFWGSLGVPEDIDGYKPPEGFEGLEDTVISDIQKIAARSGLTEKQHHEMLETFKEASAEIIQAAETAREEDASALKKEWGGAHDDNVSITDNLGEKFGFDPDMMNSANRIALMKVANAMSSDPQVFSQINTPNKGRTPDEIRNRVDDIRGLLMDKSVYGDKRKKLLKEQNKLYEELDSYAH